MARQNINTGTIANDGTGDTLKVAGDKINANFFELYNFLGSGENLTDKVSLDAAGIRYAGNVYDTILAYTESPTSEITISLPDEAGTLINDSSVQTLTNKTLANTTVDQTFAILDQSMDHQYNLISSELLADRDITLPVLSSNDTFTFNDATQTLENKTINTSTINSPQIATEIQDSAGATLLEIAPAGSAINHVRLENAAINTPPVIKAAGTNPNGHINLALDAEGDGVIEMQSAVCYIGETIVANGAIDPGTSLTRFEGGGALACTLPDPGNQNFVGAVKVLVNNNTLASDVTLTPTTFVHGTSITIRHLGVVKLMWLDNTQGWFLAEPKIYPSSDTDAMWYVT